jgi:hypothetical protein
MVEVGIYMDASASMKRPSWHAIGSKTAKRYTAPEPVLTRYKVLEIEHGMFTEEEKDSERLAPAVA